MIARLRPLLIIAAGLAIAATLLVTGPVVETRAPDLAAPLVRIIEADPGTLQLRVQTRGTVVPRSEGDLVPEVSGPITWISPVLVSGGFFSAGEALLRIDPRDYQAALEQAHGGFSRAESELADARSDRDRQLDLAKRKFASDAELEDAENRHRVAAATLREARASLDRAQRDLERTEIHAPYDGRVRSERVDLGQFVNRGNAIATVYAVDYAEVRLPVPDEQLAFLELPLSTRGADEAKAPGAPVLLNAQFAGKSHQWEGEIVRTEGEIDPKTRMVNVVARVEAPYARSNGRPPLSVGLFVEADILGSKVEGVSVIPRSALREGNRVLVVSDDDRLSFRDVEVVRLADDDVVIRGLGRGTRVCISPLASPVEGMLVRIAEAKEARS